MSSSTVSVKAPGQRRRTPDPAYPRRSRAIAESVSEVNGDAELRMLVKTQKRHAQATSQLRDLHVVLADLTLWQLEEDTQAALISSGARSYFRNQADLEHQALAKRMTGRKCSDN